MHFTRQKGATGSGYALTVGLISIVALGAVTGAGVSVTNLFGGVGDTLIEVAAADLSMTPGSASMSITSGPVPATSNPVVFSVKNIGNSPTAELTASLTNETDFVINSDSCTGQQLGSESTCTVSVSLTAVSNGSFAGTVRVGGGAKFVEAPLSGTASGLDPASLSVDQPTVSNMNVTGPGSPATGSTVTLTFTNDGEIATGTLTTANDNGTNFVISSDTCNGNTLAGGASCSMQVTPQATAGGALAASVSVGDGVTSAASSLSGTASGFALFGFTTHTFTTCGQSGRDGPSLTQCRNTYSTSWDEDSANFAQGTWQGYQLWTVPETGTYRITAAGARGGYGYAGTTYHGQGRVVRADFNLNEGDKITMVVGQHGQDRTGNSHHGGGGGGGTFVANGSNASSASLMLVAGGGGGGNAYSSYGYSGRYAGDGNGYATHYGDVSRDWGNYRGNGASITDWGGTPYGDENNSRSAYPFRNQARGGLNDPCYNTYGGFGGGGSPHCHNGAGGGGYHGGAGGNSTGHPGEGGGSYATGSNQVTNVGLNDADGYVTIQKL